MRRLTTLVPFAAFLCACASQQERYDRNLKQAYIDKSVQLPRQEIDQIIRTVSRESMFPILEITEWKSQRGADIAVYTDLSHGPQRYMVYHLKKQADGAWHIYEHGEGSIILVDRTH